MSRYYFDLYPIVDAPKGGTSNVLVDLSEGSGPYPGKLDTSYSPVGLWQFDGDLTDDGSANETLTAGVGTATYTNVQSESKQSLIMTPAEGIGGVDPAPAALRVSGDVTVQLVYTPLVEEIGNFGSGLFLCHGNAAGEAENEMYMLLLENTAGKLEPLFRYEHGANTRVTTKAAPAVYLTAGEPQHILARRWDAGGGSTSTDLWVNGTQIASLTGQTACSGGSAAYIQFGVSGGNIAVQYGLYHAAKVVDRKLTDAEVAAEFSRTGLTA